MAKLQKKLKAKAVTAKKASKPASLKKTAKPSKPASKEKVKIKTADKKSAKKIKLKTKAKVKALRKEKHRRDGRGVLQKSKTPIPVRPPPIKLTKEMQEIRKRLQQMLGDTRRDIDHEVRGASERDLAHINDTSDMASDSAEGDLALRIAESETVEASEIERAIEKIDTGTYGICEMCNQPIGAGRLEFLPYVTHCIKCQELHEIRRRDDTDELDDLAEGAEQDAENN